MKMRTFYKKLSLFIKKNYPLLFIKNSIFGKNIHPWWNFDLFWTFFIHRLRPYLLTIWDPFEPIWTLLDHFRQKWFFALNGQSRVWRKCSMNKKILFVFLKESRWAQKGHKWSKTLGLTILVPFRPFWTKLATFGPKWTIFVSFSVMNGGPQSKERLITRSPVMFGLLVEPQNVPFGT